MICLTAHCVTFRFKRQRHHFLFKIISHQKQKVNTNAKKRRKGIMKYRKERNWIKHKLRSENLTQEQLLHTVGIFSNKKK